MNRPNYNLKNHKKVCKRCEKPFIGNTGSFYCDVCRPIVKKTQQARYGREKYKKQRDDDIKRLLERKVEKPVTTVRWHPSIHAEKILREDR